MRMKNTHPEATLQLGMVGLGAVKPGEEVEVPADLCRPGKTPAGQRAPSTIEQLAPQLRPADADEEAAWLEIPGDPPRVSRLRSVGHTAVSVASLPPGVQAAVAAAQAPAEAPAAAPAPAAPKAPKAPKPAPKVEKAPAAAPAPAPAPTPDPPATPAQE